MLTNNLPTATSIHFHGVRVPNAMDGVPPYTQTRSLPAQTYTYEFEALEPAVGIYHSHSGAEQVLDGLFGAFMIGEMTHPRRAASSRASTTSTRRSTWCSTTPASSGFAERQELPGDPGVHRQGRRRDMVHYFNEGLLAHPMHLHQPVGWVIAKDGKELLVRCPVTRSTSHPASVTPCCTRPGPRCLGLALPHPHPRRGADGMFGMVTALVVEP